jgi:hypothetical protein
MRLPNILFKKPCVLEMFELGLESLGTILRIACFDGFKLQPKSIEVKILWTI